MQLRTLGTSGPIVSALGLGTMTFGNETDGRSAHQQLDMFVGQGGTFIDTADIYGSGESERIIGRWISKRGGIDDLVLATKGRFVPPQGSHGASRRSLIRSVDASLQRLQVEAIDLYFIHGWDKDTPIFETLSVLSTLVDSGKIHNIGWSNVTGWQLQKIISTATQYGFPLPVVVQPEYNLLERGIEFEVLPCCLDAQISLTPWSPLGGGWLTGKYQQNKLPVGESRLGVDPKRGMEAYDNRNNDRIFRILEVQNAIAERYQCPPAHVALAWLLARPAVASVLMGVRTLSQLEDNLAAKELVLDAEALSQLTHVSAPGLAPYPYKFVENWSGVDVWRRLGTEAAEANA